jgi:hypothetical protein
LKFTSFDTKYTEEEGRVTMMMIPIRRSAERRVRRVELTRRVFFTPPLPTPRIVIVLPKNESQRMNEVVVLLQLKSTIWKKLKECGIYQNVVLTFHVIVQIVHSMLDAVQCLCFAAD